MKKLLLPAAMLIAAMAAPAAAQDTLTSRGDVAIPKATFETLVAAMTNAKTTNDELLKRQNISEADIVIVDSKPLIEGKGDDMLKIQFDRSKDDIKQLQEILAKHPAVEARLKKESANPSVNEVIAAELLANNKLQLYYKKM
jgi:hypothetical protein